MRPLPKPNETIKRNHRPHAQPVMRLIEQRQGVTTEGKGARENLHQRGIKHGMKPEPQETRPAGLGHNKARHPLHKQRLDLQFDIHN